MCATMAHKAHTLCYNWRMAIEFEWSAEKNEQLIRERDVSFERVVSAIEQGGLVDVVEHPNKERYPGQMVYVVDIHDYLHLVPFVPREDGSRFLKTIIPNQKAMKRYGRR